MISTIDETEPARLEQLKEDSDNNRTVYGGDTIATVWYQSEAANAVPALIAEIRGLREKVEAWEWFEEVRTYDPWREHPYWTACGRASHLRKDQNSIGTKRARAFENAIAEWQIMLDAAREAVHVDSE